ncbi:MAG: hypothetical protein HND47_14680 [Chloroflexi bacterium]|nr:hypothetical protein [Chloroflexota bacterium]
MQDVQFVQKGRDSGYSFKPDGSITASNSLPDKNPAIERALVPGETVVLNQPSGDGSPHLAIPVKLRDRVIGVIHVEAAQVNQIWTRRRGVAGAGGLGPRRARHRTTPACSKKASGARRRNKSSEKSPNGSAPARMWKEF